MFAYLKVGICECQSSLFGVKCLILQSEINKYNLDEAQHFTHVIFVTSSCFCSL